MITLKLKGGLGNQMFQYAKARAEHPTKNVILNISKLKNPEKGDASRTFGLTYFNIKNYSITEKNQNPLFNFLEKVYKKITNRYDFFQDEKYFIKEKELIKREFTLKGPLSDDASTWMEKIKAVGAKSVSLHVRRGDYVNDPETLKYWGSPSPSYYQEAISKIAEKIQDPVFFIFSDDIKWAQNNLKIRHETHYVSDSKLKDYEELILMSLCYHHIIANSTFSWWGAWLGEYSDSIIIAPDQWTRKAKFPNTPVPERWCRI